MGDLLSYLTENQENFKRARLPALYSDFRSQRTLNPDGFAANIAAWKQGLFAGALAGRAPSRMPAATRNHFTLDVDEQLPRALENRQYGQPLALAAAINDAVANGELLPLQQFLKAEESMYYTSWTALPLHIMYWALRQAGLVGRMEGDDRLPRGQFVVRQNLEAGARAFREQSAGRETRFERIFSRAHFDRTFRECLFDGQRISESDFDVLIKFLSRDKKILATDGHTVKILGREAENAIVTEEDAAVASLKELMVDLTHQTEVLTKRVEQLDLAAKEAVQKKNRISALAALKSKKLTESNLSTRHVTLTQLEEVAAKIEQAADNVQLVKVMQSSTVALKNLNAQAGGAHKAEDVLDDLREQMGEVDEVGNIVTEAGPATTVDEAEVDEEFESMLAAERQKQEAASRAKMEAQQQVEAEETRKKLAELDGLGPTGDQERSPPTSGTALADNSDAVSVDQGQHRPLPAA